MSKQEHSDRVTRHFKGFEVFQQTGPKMGFNTVDPCVTSAGEKDAVHLQFSGLHCINISTRNKKK